MWFQLVQNGSTTINDRPHGLQKLDAMIQVAEQQGLYVIMSLTNPKIDVHTGGMDLCVRQFGLQNHDDFYMSDTVLTAFQNYITQIVWRYLNSPAVVSWELANDARCNNSTVVLWRACPINVEGAITISLSINTEMVKANPMRWMELALLGKLIRRQSNTRTQ
ncbi:hypothetical protein BDR04DRAFT_1076739 [Suillus decipiens]|nr:hypothetical protein BDR04DRAFT_1076739 [Suillus decipiens]